MTAEPPKVVDLMAALEKSVRDAKAASRARDVWCVKHRDGWCASRNDVEPEEGIVNAPTECGFWVTLPGGIERRRPDCLECLAAMRGPRG